MPTTTGRSTSCSLIPSPSRSADPPAPLPARRKVSSKSPHPEPAMTPNHIVFIVMDSCRYDGFMAAKTPNIDRIGEAQRRYSYASWTAPSHHAFAMGMLPHASPKNVFASEVYKEEFVLWRERTGCHDIAFQTFLPDLSLPKVLRGLGYRTVAKVSMPVLNKNTLISRDFDEYKLMPHHNDFAGM